MPVLPNMSMTTPVLGGDVGQWDDTLNAALALIDAHDHSSGKGVAIGSDGLAIDADLSFGGYSVTSLGKIAFSAIATPSTGSKDLYVDTNDNELYWRTNSGTNVKLTSGTSINVSLVGGIAGDYTAVSAQVAFDDSNDRYTFKQNSATGWARLASGEVRIYETGTSESVYIGHAVDAALASSYTVIWPAAVPAAIAQMRLNPSGAMEYQALTSAKKPLPAHSFIQIGSSHTLDPADSLWTLGNSSTSILYAPVNLGVGDIITSVAFYVNKASDATNTLSVRLVTYTASTGAQATATLGTLATDAPGASTITISPNVTIETGKSYTLTVIQSDSTPSAADKLFGAEITHTAVAA